VTGESPPTLGIVFAAYDVERTITAFRRLLEPALSTTAGRQAVIVANSDPVMEYLSEHELHSNVVVVRGSNAEAEFSAYEEGLEWMRSHGELPETVLIANDRVLSYGDRYEHVLEPSVLETLRVHAMICGSIESYHRTVPFFDGFLQTWCRSNFVLTSREALEVIGSTISVTQEEFEKSVPSEFPGRDWTPKDWVGEEYADTLMGWLTSKGSWYRAKPMSEESWSTLRAKMLAIVNEQRLSLRARQASLPLVGYKQLVLLSRLRSRQRLELALTQYHTHPFMGDDRDRSPAFRLFVIAGVWGVALGFERAGEWAVSRAVIQHQRDRRPAARDDKSRDATVYVEGVDDDM
jgi:hypothetical protein